MTKIKRYSFVLCCKASQFFTKSITKSLFLKPSRRQKYRNLVRVDSMTSDTFIGSSRRKNSVCTTLLFTCKRRENRRSTSLQGREPHRRRQQNADPWERNANITTGRCPSTRSVLWDGKSVGLRGPQTWARSWTCPWATSGRVGTRPEPWHSRWDETVWVRYAQRIQQLYSSRGGCQHICHLQGHLILLSGLFHPCLVSKSLHRNQSLENSQLLWFIIRFWIVILIYSFSFHLL